MDYLAKAKRSIKSVILCINAIYDGFYSSTLRLEAPTSGKGKVWRGMGNKKSLIGVGVARSHSCDTKPCGIFKVSYVQVTIVFLGDRE